ncbi:glycine receptor subunit alpha-4-like [Clytia hemisphaerica]|uniref:Uncharacterized protein n=1 Tax=Clytia hemisphaerica TaxID=252671 RepID=A0A7M5VAR6_9CNID
MNRLEWYHYVNYTLFTLLMSTKYILVVADGDHPTVTSSNNGLNTSQILLNTSMAVNSTNETNSYSSNNTFHEGHKKMKKKFPPEGYEGRESGVHDGPQRINLTVWVESIVNIDVSAMEYVVHGYVIQEWVDARLNGSLDHPILLSGEEGRAIWLPDLFCLSCRSSTLNSPTNGNVLIKVYPNGSIYYSQLAKLHGSCFMKLHYFPFDNQICPLNLSSYGYSNEYLVYEWKSTPVVEKMQLEQFIVNENVLPHNEIKSYPAGDFNILSFELFFTRQIGFYVLQVFIPSIVLVSLSWMTFYMEPADVGDRLSIGVTLILTMIFLLGYINQSLPKVSYIKAVDWYVIASLFMIVASVIESVLVYWLLHRKQKKQKEQNSFERFDRYLDKKFNMNNSFLPLPLLQGGAQAAGISMPNLPSLGNNQKPFYPRMTSLQELNEKPKPNGINPKKPIFAKLEEDEDIDESDKNGETNFCSEKDPLTKPVIRNRVNSKFNYHRDSLMEQREKKKSDESEESESKQYNPNLDKISKLDIFARTVFPLFYVIFTLAYFIYFFGTK